MNRDTWTTHLLAILSVVAVLVAFFALLFVRVPEGNRDMINIILGAIVTVGFGSVYSYFFGSTRGSEQKTAALATSVEATATLAATAKTAGEALAATTTNGNGADGTVTLHPGESVQVDATTPTPGDDDDPAMYGGPRP
jgi:hypothetical protein